MRRALFHPGLLLCICGISACGDDGPDGSSCGVAAGTPAGAATIGVGSATSASIMGFTWGANNDCSTLGSSVISVTLRGNQSDASDHGLGLCLPRPDLIGTAPIDLADTSLVRLVGASAQISGCEVNLAPDAIPAGSVAFAGFCTNAGTTFLMTLSGQVPGTEQCPSSQSTAVTMVLGGQVLVEPQP